MVAALLSAMSTISPLLLSDAVTFALPSMLMVLIRSPTVSFPVEVYVVVLVPSLIVIVPFLTIPSVSSDVPVASGVVPVPVAGAAEEAEEPEPAAPELELAEGDEPLESLEDDEPLVPPEVPLSALCTAAESSVLTRFRAVWLAMLAKPVERLVMAAPSVEITWSLFASD